MPTTTMFGMKTRFPPINETIFILSRESENHLAASKKWKLKENSKILWKSQKSIAESTNYT